VRALAAVPLPGGQVLLASAGEDAALRLWNPVTGRLANEWYLSNVEALAAVPLPGGQTLLASADRFGAVRLWSLDRRKGSKVVGQPLEDHTDEVRALAVVPRPGRQALLASAGDDRTVRLCDPVTGQPAGPPLEGHTAPVRALAVVPLPGGQALLASAGGDGTVRLWDLVNGRLVARVARRDTVFALLCWKGSSLAIGSRDGLTVITLASLLRPLGYGHQTDTTERH
jgi:WD40 repeat protein